MAKKKISLSAIKNIGPKEIIWDTEITGFYVRKQKGSVVYGVKVRIKRRQRWLTIGAHGSPWNPATARKRAMELLGDIAKGNDPTELREQKEAKTKDLMQMFLDCHVKTLKRGSQEQYVSVIKKNLLPSFGRYFISEITRFKVAKFHQSLSQTPRTANYALAILSKFFSWIEEMGFAEFKKNPAKGIKKFKERHIERYLSDKELENLGNVLKELEGSETESLFVIAAIRLILLTGARQSEIRNLKWEDINLNMKMIFLKDSKTGQRRISLCDAAIDLLKTIPKISGNPYVICGKIDGSNLINIQKPWTRIKKLAGLLDVRLHDLRHTYASHAVNNGVSLPIIGAQLGHTTPKTTARYAHLSDKTVVVVNNEVGNSIGRKIC